MPITQTVEIPANHQLTIDVPREVPTGWVTITYNTPENLVDECPICAQYRDPVTGNPRYNAETIAGMQEVDDMLAGKIPNTLKKFNSLDEMWEDLDSDD